MTKHTLAIDLGTTNVLTMVLDENARVTGKSSEGFQLGYPAPGFVELDPERLWQLALKTVKKALSESGIEAGNLSGIGITGQRTTIIVWERSSGKPVGPGVVWQDTRGSARADELLEQGFLTSNSLAACSKLEMVLANLPDGPARVQRGELAWGNVDSYLIYRMSGGAVHATDASNAAATGYFNYLDGWGWFDAMLDVQNLPLSFFPEIVDTVGVMGHTDPEIFGAKVPIGAVIGDQQAALYGQGCLEAGMAKITYGTSGTLDVNSGGEVKLAEGAYPSVAWSRDGQHTFLLEGMVLTAGAVFDWLTRIGILQRPSEAEVLGGRVSDANGVSFLPALQGLGTPHDIPDRYGAFEGLTSGVTKEHLVRAALEGVAFRVRELVDGVYRDTGLPRPKSLRVDGGASENNLLMQIQADVLGVTIERTEPTEVTAYGTALLAGEACGVWEPGASVKLHRTDRVFEPGWSAEEREARFSHWTSVFGL